MCFSKKERNLFSGYTILPLLSEVFCKKEGNPFFGWSSLLPLSSAFCKKKGNFFWPYHSSIILKCFLKEIRWPLFPGGKPFSLAIPFCHHCQVCSVRKNEVLFCWSIQSSTIVRFFLQKRRESFSLAMPFSGHCQVSRRKPHSLVNPFLYPSLNIFSEKKNENFFMGQQVFFSLVMHVLYEGKKLLSLVDWLFHFCQKLFWMKAETSFLGWPISLFVKYFFCWPIFPALAFLGGVTYFPCPCFFWVGWPIFSALVFFEGVDLV